MRFKINTDGAGHPDGFGGWAAVITQVQCDGDPVVIPSPVQLQGGQSGTSVDRMELTALLEALTYIEKTAKLYPELKRHVAVLWLCDRETLVRTVNNQYAAHTNRDLYYRLSYFEKLFAITGMHIPRDTPDENHQWCDKESSSLRRHVKAFVLGPPS